MKKRLPLFIFLLSYAFAYAQAEVVYASPLNGQEIAVGNLLTWKTAIEENVQLFIIEKSQNGLDFENIGTVNASEEKSYRFCDTQLGGVKNYYRLKVVELDGTSSFSEAILLQREKPNHFAVAAYNSVMVEQTFDITIDVLTEGQLDYMLLTYQGDLISEEFKYVLPGLNELQVNLTNLPEGTYTVKLKLDQEVEELVIQKIPTKEKTNVASSKKIKTKN